MSTRIPFFERLGAQVLAQWRARNFDEAALPEVAVHALETQPPSGHVTPQEILEWLFACGDFPWQLDNFGNPPIQVYAHERFLIEALFWVDGATNIHEHTFSGAFHVLAGSSLHSRYDFVCERRVSNELQVGQVQWQKSERLTRGMTRPIFYGRPAIHALFHLERPSVTVVIRTHRDQGEQLSFLPPGIAYAPLRDLPQTRLQQRALTLLYHTDRKAFVTMTTRYLQEADFHSALLLLLDFARQQMSTDILAACSDVLRERDAPLADQVEMAIYGELRAQELIRWRATATDPEHRFWLALLLNLPHRDAVFAALRERFPHVSPVDQICRWLRELSVPPAQGTPGLAVSAEEVVALARELGAPGADAVALEHLRHQRALDPLFE